MPYQELLETSAGLLEQYEAPGTTGGIETQQEKVERLSRTIDEVPDLYTWFLTLESHFDHWTDAYKEQFGGQSAEYKGMRERRDAMEHMASAAKRRWEGASRIVTTMSEFDPTGMPRSRRGPGDGA